MSDWEEIKARMLHDAEEMDGNPVSFDKAAASGVAADIRAALERVNDLENACMVHHDEVARLREENARWQDRCLAMQTERDEARAAVRDLVAEVEREYGEQPNVEAVQAAKRLLRLGVTSSKSKDSL